MNLGRFVASLPESALRRIVRARGPEWDRVYLHSPTTGARSLLGHAEDWRIEGSHALAAVSRPAEPLDLPGDARARVIERWARLCARVGDDCAVELIRVRAKRAIGNEG